MNGLIRPLALFGVPLLVIAGALAFWLQGGRYASTENAFVKADIAQIAAEIPGRVLDVRLRETRADAKESENRLAYLELQAKRQRELSGRGVSSAQRVEQADSEEQQARDRLAMLQQRIARVEAALGGNPEQPTDSYAA